MRIILSPQRRDDFIVVSKNGEKLTINDEVLDFGVLLPSDGSLPDYEANPEAEMPHPFVVGAERKGGKLTVTVIAPHGPNPDEEEGFPSPIAASKTGKVLDQRERAKTKLEVIIGKLTKDDNIDEVQLREAIDAGLKVRTDAGLSEYRATAEMLAIVREWKKTGELVKAE